MEQYKAELRIPTDQYAYINVQVEGSPEFIIDSYREFTRLSKPQAGLTIKEFNACIDRYLTDGTGETEKYMAMSPAQQETIQCIKRAYKRLESKQ